MFGAEVEEVKEGEKRGKNNAAQVDANQPTNNKWAFLVLFCFKLIVCVVVCESAAQVGRLIQSENEYSD